jgi:hypothetical protein
VPASSFVIFGPISASGTKQVLNIWFVTDAVSSPDDLASNDGMNNELERIRKEAIVS